MGETNPSLSLQSKIDRNEDAVYAASFIYGEDGVITISADRTIRVWLKRESGHFWPTVCEYLADSILCMLYNDKTRHVVVGLANGVIQEFVLSEDFNRLSHKRDFLGQIGRIRALSLSSSNDWLFSCGSSNQLMQHCLQSGVLLSTAKLGSWGTSLQFDDIAKFVFVGELSGFVTMLAVSQNSMSEVKRIQRHSGCITKLVWDPHSQWLFSASYDGLICCWDFGGGTGKVFDLRAHQNSVNGLNIVGSDKTRLLLSCGDDGALLAWKMDAQILKKRCPVAKWVESDSCQLCNVPFFWNLRGVWEQGKASGSWFRSRPVGDGADGTVTSVLPVARQHHCRCCGKAICGNCSASTSILPLYGFELPVRVCSECVKTISKEDIQPLCSTLPFSTGHSVVFMDTKLKSKQLLTVGRDRVIKIWDASSLFPADSLI